MPRQNRVTPFGEIIATEARGMWMGNRGVLHNAEGRITSRRWTTKAWIICLLEFKDRRRALMQPGYYTELFFLDEATALAAGHRPCAECRRADFNRFKDAWLRANRPDLDRRALVGVIDDQLQAERVAPVSGRKLEPAPLDGLPDGSFVSLDVTAEDAYLVLGGSLYRWSPAGYRERRSRPSGVDVLLMTPPSTVNAIRAGYTPQVHPSWETAAGV